MRLVSTFFLSFLLASLPVSTFFLKAIPTQSPTLIDEILDYSYVTLPLAYIALKFAHSYYKKPSINSLKKSLEVLKATINSAASLHYHKQFVLAKAHNNLQGTPKEKKALQKNLILSLLKDSTDNFPLVYYVHFLNENISKLTSNLDYFSAHRHYFATNNPKYSIQHCIKLIKHSRSTLTILNDALDIITNSPEYKREYRIFIDMLHLRTQVALQPAYLYQSPNTMTPIAICYTSVFYYS